MTTASASSSWTAIAPTRLAAGIVGGLAGGLIFGMLMQMMDMIPMVAMLVGSDSAGIGWLVHLAISTFIGITYALIFFRWADRLIVGALLGHGLWPGLVDPRRAVADAGKTRHERVRHQHHRLAILDGTPHLRPDARSGVCDRAATPAPQLTTPTMACVGQQPSLLDSR